MTQRNPDAEVTGWLSQFEKALSTVDDSLLASLFHADSHWRDVLALTWRIETVSGSQAVAAALLARQRTPSHFAIASDRTPPRTVTRAGRETVEAIFSFETADGRGDGVVRLTPDAGGTLKCWTLLTALEELKGHEEHVGKARPHGESYSRDFRGPNWLDLRQAASSYSDRDPEVLVVGGGQAGLSIAARLSQLGVDALIVDRLPRIGDNWRTRYHALTLHNQVQVNHLPYMPFPPNWPTYIPKDKLAGWFEAYVESLELNYWTEHRVRGRPLRRARRPLDGHACARRWRAARDAAAPHRHGDRRQRHPERPRHPVAEGLRRHGAAFQPLRRRRRLARQERARDRHRQQRPRHRPGPAIERRRGHAGAAQPDADRQHRAERAAALRALRRRAVARGLRPDHRGDATRARQARATSCSPNGRASSTRSCSTGLERIGFRLDFGEDGTGWQFKYLTRGGGYYFNVGCSDLLVEGKIRLVQFADIERFVADGARLRSGETLKADLVVLATGYKGQEALVAKLFGAAVAERVGPIWGFGESQELRNMFCRTPQPGLWFIAGSLAQCRIYSKYLALQIKALETGVLASTEARTTARKVALTA